MRINKVQSYYVDLPIIIMSSAEPLKGDAVCPCTWFGGQGEGGWRHEGEGAAKVDLGLLERRQRVQWQSLVLGGWHLKCVEWVVIFQIESDFGNM